MIVPPRSQDLPRVLRNPVRVSLAYFMIILAIVSVALFATNQLPTGKIVVDIGAPSIGLPESANETNITNSTLAYANYTVNQSHNNSVNTSPETVVFNETLAQNKTLNEPIQDTINNSVILPAPEKVQTTIAIADSSAIPVNIQAAPNVGIVLVDPTIANNTNTTNSTIPVNISLTNAPDLYEFVWNWNATNFTWYNDLRAWYDFDNITDFGENGTLLKDNSQTGNLSLGTSTSWTSAGKYDGGLSLNGNGYVALGNNPQLDLSSSSFTIELWAKWNQTIIPGNWGAAMLALGGFTETFVIAGGGIQSNDTDKLSVVINGNLYSKIGQSLNDSTWHHILVTNDSGTLKVYIDGQSKAMTNDGTPGFSTTVNRIGSQNVNFDNFNGTIDELRIYNKSMNRSEVLQHYLSNLKKVDNSSYNFYAQEASLQDPTYTYFGYAKDLLGNENNTGTRNVFVTNELGISFVVPTINNATNTTNASFPINLSITNASDLKSIMWNWNNTNYSVYDKNLVLMMNFDNVSAVGDNYPYFADNSQYSNTALAFGVALSDVSGKYDRGLNLDGTGYLAWTPGYIPTLNLSSSAFTISLWAKWNQTETINGYGTAMLSLAGFTDTFVIAGGNSGGNDNDKVSVVINRYLYSKIGQGLNDSTWHHILVTNDSGTLKVYIDGQSKAMTNAGEQGFTSTANRIGRDGIPANFNNFNGTIDELRIYNRSMNSTEVQQMYWSNLKKTASDQFLLFVQPEELAGQQYNYSAQVEDTSTIPMKNNTGTRNVFVTNELGISFVVPTINNATNTTNASFPINLSITNASDLKSIMWNWNNTNYSLYDKNLVLMMNFDNLTALGETYPFFLDASLYNNTARAFGGVMSNVSGKYDRGLALNGTGYLAWTTGYTPTLNISSGAFTISLWAKWNQTETPDAWGAAMLTLAGFTDTFVIAGGNSGGNDNDKVSVVINRYLYSKIGQGLNDSTWHHILVTNDSGTLKVYIDGQSKAMTNVGVVGFNTIVNRIGGQDIHFNNFNGTLDELRIYNRSMNSTEVQQVYWSNLKKTASDQFLLFVQPAELDYQQYNYSAQVEDTSTIPINNNTGKRNTIVSTPISNISLQFVDPSIANNTNTTNTSFPFNITINNASNIKSFVWNWNNTNYSLYDKNLVLMMNFDNLTALGETYPFFVDASLYNNTARAFGVALSNVSGKYDRGLNLDGTGYLTWTNGDIPTLNLSSSAFTISLWAKWNQTVTPGAWGAAMLTLAGFTDTFVIAGGNSGGNDNDKVSVVINRYLYSQIGQGLNDSTWHHILVTNETGTLKVYIDGQSKAMTNVGEQGFNTIANRIGSENVHFDNFNGTLDELRIYNKSMNSTEVQEMYASNLKRIAPDKFVFYVEPFALVDQQYNYSASMTPQSPTSLPGTTGVRNTIVSLVPSIAFVYPTPANATNTTNVTETINISIRNASDLKEFNWTWNKTTFKVYDDSLKLMMNFDNVTSVGDRLPWFADISKYNNTAYAFGVALSNVSGKYDRGLALDGSGYLAWTTGNIPTLNLSSGAFTISLWAKWNQTETPDAWGAAMLTLAGFTDTFVIAGGNSGGNDNDKVSVVINRYLYSKIGQGLNDSTWHHILVTNDSGTLKVYIDGQSKAMTNAGEQGFSTTVNRIGSQNIHFNNFNGTLDELRIYNRSVNETEAYQMYYYNLKRVNSDRWSFIVNETGLQGASYLNGTTRYGGSVADTSVYPNVNTTGLNNISNATQQSFVINISSPANNSATNTGTPGFVFNATGSTKNYTCNLVINSTLYGENATVNNATLTTLSANASLADGTYQWYVNCTALRQPTTNISGNFTLTIDTIIPGVSFVDPTPANGTSSTNTSYIINVSVTENASSCYLNVGGGGLFGSGGDGELVVTSANTVVNRYAYLTSNVSAGSTSFNVNGTSGFSAGDAILLYQSENRTADTGGMGEFERATISSISGSTITVQNALTHSFYSGIFGTSSAFNTQIVRIPQYTSLSVNSGGSIVPVAYNGYAGGVVAVIANNISVVGSVSVGGAVHAGGAGSGQCAGSCPDVASASSGAGPAGGYGSSCSGLAGGGGGVRGNATLIAFGAGGGGGGQCTSAGGASSGAVYISSASLIVSGSITANGVAGQDGTWSVGNAYGAGGGSGGGVFLAVDNLTLGSSKVTATGGAGGYDAFNQNYAGSGSAGNIRTEYRIASGSTSPAASNGSFSAIAQYTMTLTGNGSSTRANFTLKNLSTNSAYNYNVTCTDPAGNQNTTGTRNLNISTATSITVSGNIDIGSGYVNASFATANISTDKLFSAAMGWINTTAAYTVNATNLTIANDGGTTINLTYSVNQSVNSWFGVSGGDARIKFIDLQAGSCSGTIPTNYSLQLNTSTQAVCTSGTVGQGLKYSAQNTLAAFVNLLLPRNSFIGQHATTITFVATSND